MSFRDLPRDARKEMARRAGQASAAARRRAREPIQPYRGSLLDFMDATDHVGPMWFFWRTMLKAALCLGPLEGDEIALFAKHAGGRPAPRKPVREIVAELGRRGFKTTISALLAAWMSISRDWTTLGSRGERFVIPVVCADRRQARQQMNLLKGLFALPQFRPYVAAIVKEKIELRTGCIIEVATCDHRIAARGFACPLIVADEAAHWRSDTSVNPDIEVIRSMRPSMLTIPDSLLFAASSPYAARGFMYQAHTQHYGQDSDRVLVINADTVSAHPGVDVGEIERAWADDPLAAASEFGKDGHVSYRVDVAALFDADSVDACIMADRRELPPREGVKYFAAADPSSGKVDDMTLCIGHREDKRIVIDLIRAVSPAPKFDPVDVLRQFAEDLKRYGVRTLTADKYAAGYVEAEVRRLGLVYRPADVTTSEAYRSMLAVINSAGVELLDHPKLRAQLVQLERVARPGGQEKIRHPLGGHDDVAAAVAMLIASLQSKATTAPIAPAVFPLGPATDPVASGRWRWTDGRWP